MHQVRRRKIFAIAAVLAAGTTANAIPLRAMEEKKQLAHHVFFWLKNPGSSGDRNKLVEGVKTMSKIETIRKIHVGVLAKTEKRDVVDTSWDVSELIFFDDEVGQEIYQDHPLHVAFVKNYSHLWQQVKVYDAMEV